MKKIKNISILLLIAIVLSTLLPTLTYANSLEDLEVLETDTAKDLEENSSDDKNLKEKELSEKELKEKELKMKELEIKELESKEESLKEKTKNKTNDNSKKELDKNKTETETESTDKDIKRLYQEAVMERHNLQVKINRMKKEQEKTKRELEAFKRAINQTSAKKVPVLLYHHLLPKEDIIKYGWDKNPSVISVEEFEAQMKYLHDQGFFTATAEEIALYAKGEMRLPEKTVAITFDDGYLSNLVYGYPILKKYNMKATLFVIGNTNDLPKREFDPAGLQRIYMPDTPKYEDVFNFQSHTYDLHSVKDGLTGLQRATRSEIAEDTGKIRKIMDTYTIAYPLGRYSPEIIEHLRVAGYTSAFTTERGYVQKGTDVYRLPRFIISPLVSFNQFKNIVNGK